MDENQKAEKNPITNNGIKRRNQATPCKFSGAKKTNATVAI